MKNLFSVLTLLSVSLICSSAFALSAWEGSKFIYSVSSDSSYALKINLNTKGEAEVISREHAPVSGTFTQVDNAIKILLTEGISSIGFIVKQNPVTGVFEQVETTTTITKIVLSGHSEQTSVVEIGTECSKFYVEGKPLEERCKEHTQDNSASNPMVLRSLLKSIPIRLSAYDRLIIPVASFSSAYVQIDSYGVASPVDASIEVNSTVKSVRNVNGKIKVELKDNSTILFGKTKTIEGHNRVLGVHNQNGKESLISGLIVLDQNVSQNAFTPEGSYRAVMAGGNSNVGDLNYHFYQNGYGGFETNDTDEAMFLPWSWEFVDSKITARRYAKIDDFSAIVTVEGIKACENGSDQNCFLQSERAYKVIAKDGNRFTMLRTMDFRVHGQPEPRFLGQSVWVMYKK